MQVSLCRAVPRAVSSPKLAGATFCRLPPNMPNLLMALPGSSLALPSLASHVPASGVHRKSACPWRENWSELVFGQDGLPSSELPTSYEIWVTLIIQTYWGLGKVFFRVCKQRMIARAKLRARKSFGCESTLLTLRVPIGEVLVHGHQGRVSSKTCMLWMRGRGSWKSSLKFGPTHI